MEQRLGWGGAWPASQAPPRFFCGCTMISRFRPSASAHYPSASKTSSPPRCWSSIVRLNNTSVILSEVARSLTASYAAEGPRGCPHHRSSPYLSADNKPALPPGPHLREGRRPALSQSGPPPQKKDSIRWLARHIKGQIVELIVSLSVRAHGAYDDFALEFK